MGRGAIVRALIAGLLLGLPATAARAAIQCPAELKLDGAAVTGAGSAPQASVDPNTGDLICRYQGIHPLVLVASYPYPFCPKTAIHVAVSGGSAGWKFGPPGTAQNFAETATTRIISYKNEADPLLSVSFLGCVYGDKDYDIAVWQPNPPGEACTADNPGATFNCAPMCPSSVSGPQLAADYPVAFYTSFSGKVKINGQNNTYSSLSGMITLTSTNLQCKNTTTPTSWNLSGAGGWSQPGQSVQCTYVWQDPPARWSGSFVIVCPGKSCNFLLPNVTVKTCMQI